MGDRGHIHIHDSSRENDPGIWVYTHHYGSELLALTSAVLTASRERWNDPGYFAAQVIARLYLEHAVSGINTEPDDTGDGGRVIHLDTDKGEVTVEAAGERYGPVSFADYVATPTSQVFTAAREIGWR